MTQPGVAPQRVVLVGLMGSGKTTVGRLVARRLGWEYWDNDAELIRRTGRSLAELVELGTEELHKRERRVLVAGLTGTPWLVISAPGSVVPVDDEVAQLLAPCVVVWLRATPAILLTRLHASAQHRPLGADGRSRITAQAVARAEHYESIADQVLDVDDVDPSGLADAVVAQVRAPQGVLPEIAD